MFRRLFTVIALLMFYIVVFGFPVDVAESKENNNQAKYPQRIVSLAPALTEALYELGAADRLKGPNFEGYSTGTYRDGDCNNLLAHRKNKISGRCKTD